MEHRFQVCARFASALILLVATLAIAGWLGNIENLTNFRDSLPHMAFNTAVCFLLGGLPLFLWGLEPPDGWRKWFSLLCGGIVAAGGVLTLFEYLSGWNLGIDRMLHPQTFWGEPVTPVGRMVPSTAVNMILFGCVLLLFRSGRRTWIGQLLAGILGLQAFLALSGYAYNVQLLRDYGRYISMSLPTSLCFCLAALALLCSQPNRGIMTIISSASVSGAVARRLLPMVMIIPPILGFLRVQGERLHLFSRELGTPLLVVLHVFLFTGVLLAILRRLAAFETARNTALDAQKKSATDFESLFELSAVGQVQGDPATGRFLRVNARMSEITGYSKEELLQMTFSQLTHPDEREADFARFKMAVQGEVTEQEFKKRYVRKDARNVWVQVNLLVLRDANGKAIRTTGIIQDISARKEAEDALERENAALELERSRLRAVLEALPVGVFISDAHGRLIHANKAGQHIWGGNPPLTETPENYAYDYKAWWPNGRPVASHEWGLARVLANGKPCAAEEMEIEAQDGKHKTILNYALPIRQGNEKVTGGVAVNVDITERKRTEEALQESARLQRLRAEVAEVLAKTRPGRTPQEVLQPVAQLITDRLEAAFARVWTLDDQGTTLELQASAGMYTHLDGAHARVPIGQYKIGLIAQERTPHLTNQVLGDPRVHNQPWARDHHLVSFAGYPLTVGDRLYGVVALFSRHTLSEEAFGALASVAALLGQALARKKAEGALRQSEMALRNENQRTQLLALASGQLLSASNPSSMVRSLFENVAPVLNLHAYFNFLVSQEGHELRLDSCAGVPAETSASLQRLPFGAAVCGTVAQSGKAWIVNHLQESTEPKLQLIRSFGLRAYACFPLSIEERVIGTLSFASRSQDSFAEEDVRFMRTLSDYVAIAQNRRNYLRELEQRVTERTARLQETIGDLEHFSYSITHDMRAPLRAMQGFSRLLLGPMAEDPAIRNDFLKRIAESADRMDKLIRDALDYSKVVKAELPIGPVDPEPLIRSILAAQPEFHRPRAEIWIDDHLPKVLANETGLTQCFSNLLANSVKFVKPGERPRVRIRAETFYSRRVTGSESGSDEAQTRAQPSKRVRIWFEDHGIGIPKDSQERIFDMFARLSNDHEGTGIGLALVRKVVERMGGKAGVESDLGKGSHFWIDLPGAD